MTINRVLTFAGVLALASALVYVSLPQRQWKQPRVYVRNDTFYPDPDLTGREWTSHFRAACPHMAIVEDPQSADYNIVVGWEDKGWVTWVKRSDSARVYEDWGGKNPDAVKLLRQTCKAIWADVKDSGLPSQSSPVGRYALSYHTANPTDALLLDTKTGVVWELRDEGYGTRSFRKFMRVSVEGLYDSPDEEFASRPRK